MKQIGLFFGLTTAVIFMGCDDFYDCERGSKNVVTESLYLDNFRGINLAMRAEVQVRLGEQYHIEIRGEDNIIDRLETRVREGVWNIRADRCIRKYDELKIDIEMPYLDEVIVSGPGGVIGIGSFTTDHMKLEVSGSGSINLEVDCDNLEVEIDGSGEVLLDGIAQKSQMRMFGSGDIHGFELEADYAEVRTMGSGDTEVHVTTELDVTINGSGDVYYKGNPEIDVSIRGSGGIHNAN